MFEARTSLTRRDVHQEDSIRVVRFAWAGL
jgi:hypothetical protein